MSKIKTQGYNLGPVEKRVISTLAVNGPQTINATKNKMKDTRAHYKSVNNAFHSLMKKEVIKPIDKIEYKNQNYDRFWLTQDGVILAIIHKVNLNMLKENYEKVYGKGETSDFIFDFAKGFPEKIGEAYSIFKITTKGALKLKSFPVSNGEMQKFIKIIFKYPTYRKAMKKAIGHASKAMEKMLKETEKP